MPSSDDGKWVNMSLPPTKPVPAKTINAAYGTSFIVFTAVLVPVFIQMSIDKDALELIMLLIVAELGIILTTTSGIAAYFHGRRHHHALRKVLESRSTIIFGALLGLVCIVSSSIVVSKAPVVPQGSKSTYTADSASIALREFRVASSDEHTRVLVEVFNTSQSSVSISSVDFSYYREVDESCATEGLFAYKLENSLTMTSEETVEAVLSPSGGPLDGFEVHATGAAHVKCGEKALNLSFPATLSLDSMESKYLAIDLPNSMNVVDRVGDRQLDQAIFSQNSGESFTPFTINFTTTSGSSERSDLTLKLWHGQGSSACLTYTTHQLGPNSSNCTSN